MTAVGVLMERLIIRPIAHADVLNLIIVTIGASILIKGGVMVSLGKNAAGLPAFTGERPIHVLGATFVPQALWIVGVACAIVVVLHLFFDRTLLGKAMRAVASDREAARLMGIDVGRIVMLSFALGAAVGAIGGLIVTPVTLTIYDAGTHARPQGLRGRGDGRARQHLRRHRGRAGPGPARGLRRRPHRLGVQGRGGFLLLLLLLFVRPRGLLRARRERARMNDHLDRRAVTAARQGDPMLTRRQFTTTIGGGLAAGAPRARPRAGPRPGPSRSAASSRTPAPPPSWATG